MCPVTRLPRTLDAIGAHIGTPELPRLAAIFVHNQVNVDAPLDAHEDIPTGYDIDSRISVFPSAVSTYYAPSDLSGIGGMHRERIRTTQSWRSGPPRRDCVFVEKDASMEGFRGLHVARVRVFLSFEFRAQKYPCALVEWFSAVGDEPDDVTGMWVVEPDFNPDGSRSCEIIHTDCIIHSAHLIPVYGSAFLPPSFHFSNSLDAFSAFYVNKYADYHAHNTVF